MAYSRNRAGVKRRIVEIAKAALPDVAVSYEWPGDNLPDSFLFLESPVSGNSSNDALGGSPGPVRQSVDRFTIKALLQVGPKLSAEDAERAVDDALALLDNTLRRLHRLKDPSGAISDGTATEYAGVRSVDVGRAEGPVASQPQANANGPVRGLYMFDLDCVSDL